MASRLPVLLLLGPALAVIVLFLGALVGVLALSVQPVDGGPALGLYAKFLGDPYYLQYLWNSLWIAGYTTFIGLVIGYPIAFVMCRGPRPLAVGITLALAIQFFSIYVIKMYGWMLVLGNNGVINKALLATGLVSEPVRLMYNELGVAIGLFGSALPLMVFPINAALQNVDTRLEEAATGLGASRLSVLTRITIPLSGPGIVGGSILMFVFCFTAYLTPSLLGGGFFKMIGNFIFEQAIANYDYPFASAAAVITLLVSLFAIVSVNLISRRIFGGWS